jgi:hypothetical protein
MMSELRTKKGSSPSPRTSRASAKGPAVPNGSVSCDIVILMLSCKDVELIEMPIICGMCRLEAQKSSTDVDKNALRSCG